MASVFARLSPAQSGYISMITGPSRTADIERVLTIGVHGPSRLVIVFVDEVGRNR
jgi:L-lactate dehydrogenase complex protein LldG